MHHVQSITMSIMDRHVFSPPLTRFIRSPFQALGGSNLRLGAARTQRADSRRVVLVEARGGGAGQQVQVDVDKVLVLPPPYCAMPSHICTLSVPGEDLFVFGWRLMCVGDEYFFSPYYAAARPQPCPGQERPHGQVCFRKRCQSWHPGRRHCHLHLLFLR